MLVGPVTVRAASEVLDVPTISAHFDGLVGILSTEDRNIIGPLSIFFIGSKYRIFVDDCK